MIEFIDILLKSPVFSGLSQHELENLFKKIGYNKKSFDKENIILSEGEECKSLLILVKGSVRGEMTDNEGKILKIEDIFPPRPLAPSFLFARENKSPVSIIANEPSIIYVISKESFVKLMQENEKVLYNFLKIISDRTQFLSYKIKFLHFNTIKRKILIYIYNISGGRLKNIYLNTSQTKLAEYFGISRPSLGRVLNELEKEGFFKVCRNQITNINLEKIKDYIF